MTSEIAHGIGIDFGAGGFRAVALEGSRFRVIAQQSVPSIIAQHGGADSAAGTALHFQTESIKRGVGMLQSVAVGNREVSSDQLATQCLRELKERCERELGASIAAAMLAVPPCFTDRQRAATLACAEAAGFGKAGLVNDPSAAAVVHRRDSKQSGRWLVYGLGKSAFWVTVIDATAGVEEMAHRGDIHLGGEDFDGLLLTALIESHKLQRPSNEHLAAGLLRLAEDCKKRLSTEDHVSIEDRINDGTGHALAVRFNISRAEFERLVEERLSETIRLTERTLEQSRLRPEQIDRVLLVGGSTRIPWIKDRLRPLLPAEFVYVPEDAVAQGAALYSTRLGDCFTPGRPSAGVAVSGTPTVGSGTRPSSAAAERQSESSIDLYRKAQAALDAEDLATAIKYYEEFLVACRRHLAFVYKQHAARLEGSGHHKDAVEILEDFLKPSRLNAAGAEVVRSKLSDIYFRLAMKEYEAARQVRDRDKRERLKRCKSFLKQAKLHNANNKEAVEMLRRLG